MATVFELPHGPSPYRGSDFLGVDLPIVFDKHLAMKVTGELRLKFDADGEARTITKGTIR
jgi:hypothetical protein